MTIPTLTDPPLTLCLFGPFEARVNGVPLRRLRSRKGQWLLALLALRQGREVERDWLAGTLWPDSTPTQASHSLNMCLTDLRQALGPEAGRLRSPTRRVLCLELTGMSVDVLAFDAAMARGDPGLLEQAMVLYRGPLLEACSDDWAFPERQAREQAYLTANETLAAYALACGHAADAERHLRAVVAIDPLREQTQRALMELLAAGGNAAAALHLYRELRQRLHRELHAEPDPETQALFQRLRTGLSRNGWTKQQAVAPLPEEGPNGAASSGLVSHNLPLQLTSFVGRQTEKEAIRQQLVDHRLVTLTGAGGCGKTRLAIEAANGLDDAFPQGIWFIELASLADPTLVPQTMAAALGIREQPNRPLLQTLVSTLQPKLILLVLDNCEHLVEACAQLAETLLQTCPDLRILATSREPLVIAGEQPYRVPSLSLPAIGHPGTRGAGGAAIAERPVRPGTRHPDPATLMQSEAVRLFVERAVTAQPTFVLTPENMPEVAQICRRLDGIPLAIELAAARLKSLPLDQLCQRLDDIFGLLTHGRRTALPRHQTLRASIDWSYDLLTPPEQALLRRLSVFAGGCTLEAAEAVCADPGAAANEPVLDRLTSLVDRSLVTYEERDSEGRYRLLEMIREYARERLTGAGEADELRERHARFFLTLADAGEGELTQAGLTRWLDPLDREHDNLRSALSWSIESGRIEFGLRLGSALREFWHRRGHLKEALHQFLTLLAQPGAAAPTAARTRAQLSAARFAEFQDLSVARPLYEESLSIARALGDRESIATALLRLGTIASDEWDLKTAPALVEEGLAIRRELGNAREVAGALTLLAQIRRLKRDIPGARALVEESLAIWRSLEGRTGTNGALGNLQQLIFLGGDLDALHPLVEESLAAARKLGDQLSIAWGITILGYVLHFQEDYPAALALFAESLSLWRELDHKMGLTESLFHLGCILQHQGDARGAYEYFEELLQVSREWSNRPCIAASLILLGGAAAELGRQEEGATRCCDGLRHCRPGERGDPHHIAWAFTRLAGIALARARPVRAARLLGASPALLAVCSLRWPNEGDYFDRFVSATRSLLGEAEFDTAWAEGQAMSLEQVIAEALQEAPAR